MRDKIKYTVLPFILSVLLILPVFPALTVSAQDSDIKIHMNMEGLENPPDITAEAAIVLNARTGDILYEKNSRKIIFPASTVKIMTAILVFENAADLDSKAAISKYVVDKTAGNRIGVKEGEVFTVTDLLSAMLLQGTNDAALALAEYVAGDAANFVARMNERAKELGCENTVFTNPTGMHSDEMKTTVSDMAKIALHASKIQKLMDIASSPKYTIPPTNKHYEERTVLNHNHFVSTARQTQYYYSHARGLNYGYTEQAKYCLTTVADQTELSYLCILMGASDTPISGTDSVRLNCFFDARYLLEWAFSIYSYKTVVKKSDNICSVNIELAENRDKILLVPDTEISVLLPQNADLEKEIIKDWETFDDRLVAPIVKGQELGKLTVYYKGEIVGTAMLLSNSDVERSTILYVLDQIKEIVSGNWFKASVVIFIVIFAFYVVIMLLRKSKKEQKRFY